MNLPIIQGYDLPIIQGYDLPLKHGDLGSDVSVRPVSDLSPRLRPRYRRSGPRLFGASLFTSV